MKAEEIASHYKAYHRYGIDIPVCLDALSRVVAWRDRQVTGWPKGVSIFKQVFVKSAATLGIVVVLALSIAEFVLRNVLFLFSIPLQPFESTRMPSVRIQESTLSNLNVTLFALEAIRHNLVEKQVGQKMIHPRLTNYYLDFYEK